MTDRRINKLSLVPVQLPRRYVVGAGFSDFAKHMLAIDAGTGGAAAAIFVKRSTKEFTAAMLDVDWALRQFENAVGPARPEPYTFFILYFSLLFFFFLLIFFASTCLARAKPYGRTRTARRRHKPY